MGVDPGVARLGYAFIEIKKKEGKLKAIDYGCITTAPGLSNGERLKILNNELNKMIKKYKPTILAIEKLYFFKNLKTAMPVSQAKGVILLTAAKKNIPVYEFTPLQVKMAVVGYGKAEKKQVQKMIRLILHLKELPRPDDAADALAIAVCYAILPPHQILVWGQDSIPKASSAK